MSIFVRMRILGLNITRQKRSTELLSDQTNGHSTYLRNLFNIKTSVNESNSLSISAVYSCVQRISCTVASLPISVLREDNGNKRPDLEHNAHQLLSVRPNSYQTPFAFMEQWVYRAVLFGRSGALIQRDGNGMATALHVLPGRLTEIKHDGQVLYQDGTGTLYRPMEVLVLENFAGMSPIRLHMENLGLSMNAQTYGADYFKNGGGQIGVLMTDSELNDTQFKRLKKDWNNSSTPTKVLEKGIKYQRLTASPEELQFLETRKFQTEEIARIFGVPLHLIQGDGNTTYSNVEQLMTIYAQTTVLPWVERAEQEMESKLLSDAQRPTHCVEYALDNLLRADQKTLTNKINTLLRAGVISFNEARGWMGLNPIEDGEKHMVQLNQIPLADMDNYASTITQQNNDGAQG